MPGRGRPRKTREQKLTDGTFQPCRDRPTVQGEVIESLPDPPVPMTNIAYQYYKGIGNQLISLGILNTTDLTDLETYANQYGEYWRLDDKYKVLEKELKELDERVKDALRELDKSSYRMLNEDYRRKFADYKEANKQKRECLNTALKMSSRFGLNPIDRQKLSIAPPTDELDPFAEI